MFWAEDAATLDRVSPFRLLLQFHFYPKSLTQQAARGIRQYLYIVTDRVSMESSRVFVQGLPPSLSSEDFQKHFSKVSSTTDAKLFPHRRIGYVGYSSHDEACKAVKYFNKSYIRMSRIRVELAKPAASLSTRQVLGQERAAAAPAVTIQGSLAKQKRKYDAVDSKEDPAPVPSVTNHSAETHSTHVSHDFVNRQASKRQKTPLDQSSNILITDTDAQGAKNRLDEGGASKVTSMINVDTEPKVDNTSNAPENPPASDADWLRSRTSRLLGLLDDDEVQEPTMRSAIREDHHSSDDENSESQRSTKDSVANAQIGKEEVDETEVIRPDNAAAEDKGPRYNRLFIRNLAYSITESDLRELFGKHGSLDEVSHTDLIPFTFAHLLIRGRTFSNDEYPDRDILCFAKRCT